MWAAASNAFGECVANIGYPGMMTDTEQQLGVQMSHQAQALAIDAPLVASPNQAMKALLVSRSTLYALINDGELESYTEGRSRRITVESINAYVKRRLATEADRRSRGATSGATANK